MLGKLKIALKKVTNRPKIGTLRVKWLKELEQEKDLGVLTRFKERYIKGRYKAVITKYFLMDRLYTLIELY